MSSLIVEVCKVDKIEKHFNADRLSVVEVKGWNVIVGLDQYKVGDLIVFCPPDCIIPGNIIEKYNLEYLKKDGRTTTVKLRGVISQGLVLDLPEGKWKVGDDVSGVLGITKYEPPEPKYSVRTSVNQTSKKKLNPLFHKYCDIENIKNYNDIFKLGDNVCVTEKIHGANIRGSNLEIFVHSTQPLLYRVSKWFEKYILKRTHAFIYGSHNVQITSHDGRKSFYGEDVWGKMCKKYNLANVIEKDFIVYGEVYGFGIQDLTYGLKDIDLVVYDMKYKSNYLDWDKVKFYANKWGLKLVPELYVGEYYPELLELTNGKSVICPSQIREGIVIKMQKEENHPQIGRKILKSVSTDYLTRKAGTEFK